MWPGELLLGGESAVLSPVSSAQLAMSTAKSRRENGPQLQTSPLIFPS